MLDVATRTMVASFMKAYREIQRHQLVCYQRPSCSKACRHVYLFGQLFVSYAVRSETTLP